MVFDHSFGQPEAGKRTVLVGVKLDSRSRELLTWALVKVALPGDQVIAVHVLDAISEGPSSLLSLVKTFDSVLSVYEGFCNLKQVDLKLKLCRGKSVRKVLVREATSYPSAIVVVGISKTHHRILSSASVAKHCAAKLSRCFTVFAVDNGKVIFKREATESDQSNGSENYVGLLQKSLTMNVKVLDEGETYKYKCHHRIRKSCSKCRNKTQKRDCVSCTTVTVLPENSTTHLDLEDNLSNSDSEDNSLALVPIQAHLAPSNSLVIRDSQCLKPGWALLRRMFLPKRQFIEKSVKKTSVLQWILRLPSWHCSAVVYPDQKQSIMCHQDEDHCSNLGGDSGAIVPFGYSISSPLLPNSGLDSFPKELLNLHEKYSATCRLFSFQELLQATSNFIPENMVGRGGSSSVYRGCLSDGKELAVKMLKPSEDVIKEFVQEIDIITALNHKNIISLFGFCFEDVNLLLVYDFLSRGSLEENLHGPKKDGKAFGWQERYYVAVGVAEALEYLHNDCKEPVIHRDVKSSNILLSDDFEPQLSDFGLASWASASSHITCTDVAGTFGYLAPEYFMHGKVSDKIDVYAFGVVLLELLSGRRPINSEYPKGQESLVMWARPILKSGKVSQLLDPDLGCSDSDQKKIELMVMAATLCIRRVPRLRPQISVVLKLLQGDEEVTKWARQQVSGAEDQEEAIDGEPLPTNIQSHLNLALLDMEDDSLSVSSGEQGISLEDYLRGRWSRSSSFD
ncbi:protein kinase STUNTED-like [Humulus lupulus]|uniref:protein kinase STUNTED-like n=1 Tax=Humulus lupulus TaxID=3486 RepID=UPI002B40A854|nr:protein kinase STUNTED-like [Humulus lupulus]